MNLECNKKLLYLIDLFVLKVNVNLNFYIFFNSQLISSLSSIQKNKDNTKN